MFFWNWWFLILSSFLALMFSSSLSGTQKMKFHNVFRMRAAARCRKERCQERPPERIPHLKLDCYLTVWCFFNFERNPKNEIPDTIPHARTRADAKRGVSGAATGANSLLKTGLFPNSSMFFQFSAEPQKYNSRYYSACADPPGRKKRGVGSGHWSEFHIQNWIVP